jgi:hypothetical protein
MGPGAVDSTMMVGITVITIGGTLVGGVQHYLYTSRPVPNSWRHLRRGTAHSHWKHMDSGLLPSRFDPLWPAKALPYDHGFLAFLWATGFSLIGA